MEIFLALKIPEMPSTDFLLSDTFIARMCEALVMRDSPDSSGGAGGALKKSKADTNWKQVHEQAYSQHSMTWPPLLPDALTTLPHLRQAEVAFFANEVFPMPADAVENHWEWFDTNHTFERSMK